MQYRQPRHRCGICATMPVAGSTSTAFCGQTATHGVSFSHCWHIIGTNTVSLFGKLSPFFTAITCTGVMPVLFVAFISAGGTLFSIAHATMHAPRPLHRSRSITIPYRAVPCLAVSMSYAFPIVADVMFHVPSVVISHNVRTPSFLRCSGAALPLGSGPMAT